ncbi:hypothetical protein JYU34_017912 [Plutella xylostella]|uniref:C2H2-type domain-containing protein n=1 Tax=Plutella xylostella TaxID=51655 RepID=A0ABQ7Q325_PLUXY|nr:hypothetical protein JYU34_017912 [Plutella xylostella]
MGTKISYSVFSYFLWELTSIFLFLGKPEETETKTSASGQLLKAKGKRAYEMSARTRTQLKLMANASSVLRCWSVCPFRWLLNTYRCGYCEESFTEFSRLRRHIHICSKSHSTKDIYSKFREKGRPIKIDISEGKCRECKAPFSDVADMKDHVIRHGYEYDENYSEGVVPFELNKDKWRCVICHEVFSFFSKLNTHMNSHYPHFICSVCGKCFITASRLRAHGYTHDTGPFPCQECGRTFTTLAARESHKSQVHCKTPRYQCPYCKIRFTKYDDRNNHMSEKHNEKAVAYKCEHCDSTFSTTTKRFVHNRRQHCPLERSFKCDFCEWQFKTKYELGRHRTKHTGERPFRCSVCPKTFVRRTALAVHLRTHEDFKCGLCEARFTQKSLLHSHLKEKHPDSE